MGHTLFVDVGSKGPTTLRGLPAEPRKRTAQLRRYLLGGQLHLASNQLPQQGHSCPNEGPCSLLKTPESVLS